MIEFFRVLKKNIELASDFEDFYKRNFCLDLDSGQPDLNASFYKIDQPNHPEHPIRIISEHSAHCLRSPARKSFGVKIPTDSPFRLCKTHRVFSFSGDRHCELTITNKSSLRKIAQEIYDQATSNYKVNRDQILQYIDKMESGGNSEWVKFLNIDVKKGWRSDLERWRKRQQSMRQISSSESNR